MTVPRVIETNKENPTLPYLSQQERLEVFNLLTAGAQHLWSKGKIQDDRINEVLKILVPLTQKDPYFLAHLTSYIYTQAELNKDMKVLTAYTNALSSADGTPFSIGSEYYKPNLRMVSAAAINMLDPKMASRIAEFEGRKWAVDGYFNLGRHFPSVLRTALKKYLMFREQNPEILRGVTKAGLKDTIKNIYIKMHLSPSDEAASILRWKQKDGRDIKFEDRKFDFAEKSDLEIAESIRSLKLPFLVCLGELARVSKKISPVIAVALLEQATGDQAVISRKTFEDAGILKDPEVSALFESKVRQAKSALDRLQSFSEKLDKESQRILKEARADVRKEQFGEIGKVYLHLDASGSMNIALTFAKEKGSMIAEMVQNPEENFAWGLYDHRGLPLPLPRKFVSDAFQEVLFARTMGGGTDCFALYPNAREFGADVDVQVTDGGHNADDLRSRIQRFHEKNPTLPKPKACVIVDFSPEGTWSDRPGYRNPVKEAYEDNGIPVSVIKPETLNNSALVVSAIKVATQGPLALIDTIMETPLLKLPTWYLVEEGR